MGRILVACALVVMLLVLPGCRLLWGSGTAGEASAAETQARADIRGAVPAIEAFYVDNGTYAGVTVIGLRTTYDSAVPDVRVVVSSPDSYCVESKVDGLAYSKMSRQPDIRPGRCPDAASGAPSARPAAADQLRTVVVVMEGRLARTGSFEGVTAQWLGRMVPGLGPVRVVRVEAQSYCIEMSGEGHTYAAHGPGGDVGVGRC